MRRLLIPVMCALLLGLAVSATAGSANSLLFPYQVNKLEDNDWESIVLGDTDTLLEKGELLVGMVVMQDVWNETETIKHSPDKDTFTGIFVLEVDSVAFDSVNNVWVYQFKPYGKDWSTLTGLGLPTQQDIANTMGILYSDYSATGGPWVNQSEGTGIKDALETAWKNNTTGLWEVGFETNDGTEFWQAFTNTQDISKLIALNVETAINVTHYYPDGVPLLPHDHLGYGALYHSGATYDLEGQGAKGSGTVGWFQLPTDGDWYIKPTPEPGSFVLIGLGLAACGLVVRRRRK